MKGLYKLMQTIYKVKKYLFLIVFLFVSLFMNAATTNFLPLEDGLFVNRNNEVVYGASIDATKPYRQPVAMIGGNDTAYPSFGSTDILICILLLGVYFIFTHRRSQTRNIDI